MLLITRKPHEGVVINGTIAVTVVEVKGNRVKLGFDYPEGNTVYRKELFVKIQEENKSAASSAKNIGDILKKLTNKGE